MKGKRIYLRELELEDASEKYISWLNDPGVNQFLGLTKDKAITEKITIEDLRDFIIAKMDKNCYFMGIFLKGTNEHIGNIKLEYMIINGKATWGIGLLIGEKQYWNQGIGTEAVRLMLDYAFKELGISEVILAVKAENKGAIRVYEKVGFRLYDKLLYYKIGNKVSKIK